MKKPTPVSLTSAPPCAALVLALALATSACQPGAVATPTTPAPPSTVYHCGNINETCSKADFDKFEEKRKLAEQAEQVYRKYYAEYSKLMFSGGSEQVTPVLGETTADSFQSMVLKELSRAKQLGLKGSGQMRLGRIEPYWDLPSGAVVGLKVCEDARGATFTAASTGETKGALVQATVAFAMKDGHLKAVDSFGKGAGTCA